MLNNENSGKGQKKDALMIKQFKQIIHVPRPGKNKDQRLSFKTLYQHYQQFSASFKMFVLLQILLKVNLLIVLSSTNQNVIFLLLLHLCCVLDPENTAGNLTYEA